MKLKQVIATIAVSTTFVLACSSVPPAAVDGPDSWVEADMAAARSTVSAVLGYESGPASSSSAELEPAPSETWEVTEGHVTLVRYDDTE